MAMIPDPNESIHGVGFSIYNRCWIMAFTFATTIGYGLITPLTAGGQVFAVIFSIISIPITGLALVFLAERVLYVRRERMREREREREGEVVGWSLAGVHR